MIQELSTEINYAVIIFHDKSKKQITEKQYSAIIAPYTDPNVARLDIDGSLYAKSAIAKILTLIEFYQEYPDEKPGNRNYGQPSQSEEYFNPSDFRSEKFSKNGLLSLIRGIRRAIAEFQAEGRTPNKALELLAKAETQYKNRYGEYPSV